MPMLHQVYMGDETAEILGREAEGYRVEPQISPGQSGKGLGQSIPGQHMKSTLAPRRQSPRQALGDKGRATTGDPGVSSKDSIHHEQSESPLEGMPERTRVERIVKSLAKIHGETAAVEDKTSKRRRVSEGLGGFIDDPPELDIDPDLFIELELDPSSIVMDDRRPPSFDESASTETSNPTGLNLRFDSETDMSISSMRAQIRELSALLDEKTQELRGLKSRLSRTKRQAKLDMEEMAEGLHRAYSKQASEKLRLLYKQASQKAEQNAELRWGKRVDELQRQVSRERSEKTELVQACDEYLQLNGF